MILSFINNFKLFKTAGDRPDRVFYVTVWTENIKERAVGWGGLREWLEKKPELFHEVERYRD